MLAYTVTGAASCFQVAAHQLSMYILPSQEKSISQDSDHSLMGSSMEYNSEDELAGVGIGVL